jgi:hypothetical protein
MQSYWKAYQIYKGSCNMGQQPVMWIEIILRKPKFHLRYKSMVLKVATQGEAPQRRPIMGPRDMLTPRIRLKNPLVRKMTTPRNYLTVRLIYIFRGEERQTTHFLWRN